MDVQNILIFAFLGAVCMFIVTGGFVSMTTNEEPEPSFLASGAALGGTLGAALAVFQTGVPISLSSLSSLSVPDITSAPSNSNPPEMKVGLPNF